MKSDPHLDISGCRGRRTKSTWAVVLLWASLAIAPVAQAADAGRIIVTNARPVGRDESAQDVPVNLLIVDYRLDIPLPADLTLSVGKQRQAMSMERLTALTFRPCRSDD